MKRISVQSYKTLTDKNVSKDIITKIDELRMFPSDWSNLSISLNADEYRAVVNEYQKRENASRPKCGALFMCCIYAHGGKCFCKTPCQYKR